MTTHWNVPYVGQVGDGANEHGNDCGPASVAMILKYANAICPTVDALFNEVKPSGDGYTSFGDLCKLLDARGIEADYDAGVSNSKLYEYLIKGMPVIALIRYDGLEAIRPNKFNGSHFVVVTGIDLDTVYINDPLNTPTAGETVAVPFSMWDEAWGTLGEGNPQRSLIIPSKAKVGPGILRIVYPRDWNGCNIRSVPGDTTQRTRLFGVPYDGTFTKTTSRMSVYEIRVLDQATDRNWGRIHPTQQWWVCLDYTN